MKVGIMSMQRIKNYGSFLQSYGLKKEIEKLGHEVSFVDYEIGEPIVKEREKIQKPTKKKNIVYRIARKIYRILRTGVKKSQPVPTIENIYNEHLKMLGISDVRTENMPVDTLVIGSDEVFNCLQENPDVGYSPQLFGEKVNAKKVISYAASCGFTTKEGLAEYKKDEEVGRMLKENFSKISVRDKNSFNVVKSLSGIEPCINQDPVLISDFEEEIIEKKDIKKYMIIYAYSGRINSEDEINAITAFAKKENLKTVSIGAHQSWTDIKIAVNPFETLGYFKNADYVVTDTFHGTIFSIITKSKFATIIRQATKENSYSNSQKLTSLLEVFGLETRKVSDLSRLGDILKAPIDYDKVSEIRRLEREKAIAYLKENI